MLRALTIALALLTAAPAFAQSLRLDYRSAHFVWSTIGEDSNLAGFIVRCGGQPKNYVLQSATLPIDAESFNVADLLRANGLYYCSVAATDGRVVIAESNEIALQVRGRWVTPQ